ncbi:MAG: polyphosphate kinase 2 family protein [Propionibacteriaceae bacterium]|jgi:PPK2 family polyphosphate:nucleotide phosphotransferase|nr:polyphosphate kinase 2 family protein [Propionibacteriaceae bacterium]
MSKKHSSGHNKKGGAGASVVADHQPVAVPLRARPTVDLRAALRAPSAVKIADLDPSATPGYPGKSKKDAAKLTAILGPTLSDWQERLYAQSRDEDLPRRSILVILQGMDTSGKSGVVRHVFGLVDPQGLMLHAFKQPTNEELSHSFLWRIRRHLPTPGMIGIFDRSQYEDVLVARVDSLVEESVWSKRYEAINRFESEVVAQGTTVVKCFLNISPDEQKRRLLERLSDPTKYWKYSPGDVVVRRKWADYMAAYEDMLNRCNTEDAPWYVIPADRKWYRNWAIASLILEHLRQMDPVWPKPEFIVAEQVAGVETSLPSVTP